MQVTKLKRVFILKGDDKKEVRLSDPNPLLTPEEVLDHYSGEYPKLNNSVVVQGEEKNGELEFEIKSNFGPKG